MVPITIVFMGFINQFITFGGTTLHKTPSDTLRQLLQPLSWPQGQHDALESPDHRRPRLKLGRCWLGVERTKHVGKMVNLEVLAYKKIIRTLYVVVST